MRTSDLRHVLTLIELMKNFRDLRVWHQSMDFVETVYRLTQQFPKQEMYGLSRQIQRAVVSVPSNIAEGHTREHIKEYLHHLSIAQASLAEVETQLEIATRLGYVPRSELPKFLAEISSVGKQLYALRNALQRI